MRCPKLWIALLQGAELLLCEVYQLQTGDSYSGNSLLTIPERRVLVILTEDMRPVAQTFTPPCSCLRCPLLCTAHLIKRPSVKLFLAYRVALATDYRRQTVLTGGECEILVLLPSSCQLKFGLLQRDSHEIARSSNSLRSIFE